MIEWLSANWELALAGFYLLEKLVKLTPTQYDDILIDVVWANLKKIVKK